MYSHCRKTTNDKSFRNELQSDVTTVQPWTRNYLNNIRFDDDDEIINFHWKRVINFSDNTNVMDVDGWLSSVNTSFLLLLGEWGLWFDTNARQHPKRDQTTANLPKVSTNTQKIAPQRIPPILLLFPYAVMGILNVLKPLFEPGHSFQWEKYEI